MVLCLHGPRPIFLVCRTQYSREVTAFFPSLREEDRGLYYCEAVDFNNVSTPQMYRLTLKGTLSCIACQTVIALDIFLTCVTSVRWWKWFTEPGQIITVTGQIHGHPYHYRSCPSKHQLPSLPKTHARTHTHRNKHTHTHTHAIHTLSLCCGFCGFLEQV